MRFINIKKATALIICLFLLTTTFFSLHFISDHEIHDCVGEECEICCLLELAKQSLRQIKLASALNGLLFVCIGSLLKVFIKYILPIPADTLINQNVRLDC